MHVTPASDSSPGLARIDFRVPNTPTHQKEVKNLSPSIQEPLKPLDSDGSLRQACLQLAGALEDPRTQENNLSSLVNLTLSLINNLILKLNICPISKPVEPEPLVLKAEENVPSLPEPSKKLPAKRENPVFQELLEFMNEHRAKVGLGPQRKTEKNYMRVMRTLTQGRTVDEWKRVIAYKAEAIAGGNDEKGLRYFNFESMSKSDNFDRYLEWSDPALQLAEEKLAKRSKVDPRTEELMKRYKF